MDLRRARCVFDRALVQRFEAVTNIVPLRAPLLLAQTLGHDLISVLAPDSCRVCDEPLSTAGRLPVCTGCLAAISPQKMLLCRQCGESMGMESVAPDSLCSACREDAPEFIEARAYGEFEGNLRALIHLMKFEGMPEMSRELGPRLAQTMLELRDAPAEMLVVPVPLFRGKRSFNQSERLAKAALQAIRRERPDLRWTLATTILTRIRKTESQYGLSPRQRRLNLRGAFQVSDGVGISGRHVLLIDDIYTTGATARECSRTLLQAGAASVRVATVARAQRDTAAPWSPSKASPVSQISSHPPSPLPPM